MTVLYLGGPNGLKSSNAEQPDAVSAMDTRTAALRGDNRNEKDNPRTSCQGDAHVKRRQARRPTPFAPRAALLNPTVLTTPLRRRRRPPPRAPECRSKAAKLGRRPGFARCFRADQANAKPGSSSAAGAS